MATAFFQSRRTCHVRRLHQVLEMKAQNLAAVSLKRNSFKEVALTEVAVAVQELELSYNNPETIVFTICIVNIYIYMYTYVSREFEINC